MKIPIWVVAFSTLLACSICFAQEPVELISGSSNINANSVFGGKNIDRANSVVQADNGDFIIVGWTTSFKVRTQDVLVQRIDVHGDVVWTKTFGKYGSDGALTIQKAADGYFIGGTTNSFKRKNNVLMDNYLLKIGEDGKLLWENHTGKNTPDYATMLRQTGDGGYVVAGNVFPMAVGFSGAAAPSGSSRSSTVYMPPMSKNGMPVPGGTVRVVPKSGQSPVGNIGSTFSMPLNQEIYITKLDGKGKIIWTQKCCEMLSENVSDILEDKDGGYILAGETAKYSAMGRDILIAKLDADGKKQWEKYYGEKYDDSAVRVVPTADGGFAVAGTYGGFTSINKDIVVLKLDADGDKVWEKVFGGKDSDSAAAVRQTKDLGFIVAGSTSSYGNGTSDVYVVKLRHNGDIEWERTFGGGRGDGATDVIQTQDGGYAVLGYTDSYNKNTTKILLIRLDANGAEVPFDRAKTE